MSDWEVAGRCLAGGLQVAGRWLAVYLKGQVSNVFKHVTYRASQGWALRLSLLLSP